MLKCSIGHLHSVKFKQQNSHYQYTKLFKLVKLIKIWKIEKDLEKVKQNIVLSICNAKTFLTLKSTQNQIRSNDIQIKLYSSFGASCNFIVLYRITNTKIMQHLFIINTLFEMGGGVHASRNSFSTADRDTRARAHTRL